MPQVWKIAPGKGAENWDLFRQHGCIGLGWLKVSDYSAFGSESEVLSALERHYGKGAKGAGSGAAKIIWRFLSAVEPNDIIVANHGYNRVVGIGVVTSQYLAPTNKTNPLRHDKTSHRHHVRRVNWIVTEPVELAGDQFFVQSTLWPLTEEKFTQIREAYETQFPELETALDQLLGESPDDGSGWLPEEVAETPDLYEGAVKQVTVNAYERNPKARAKCLEIHGTECCVCGFRFGAIYGPEAEGYIHVHHLQPLATVGKEYVVNPEKDLRPVCPNCHAVLHLGGKCHSIEDVQRMLAQHKRP